MITHDQRLADIVGEQPYPLLFTSVSGAHLYGFASPDSDVDLRGVHVLPLPEVVGIEQRRDTLELSTVRTGLEIDLVTHDVEKCCRLLLRRNGYVLEQLCSPLIVETTAAHAELRALVPQLLTRHHAHHYLGFAETQWRLFEKETPRRIKPLLYTFRVLLTGIHLMRTGSVEANLVSLNEIFRLPYVAELIDRKISTAEQATLPDQELALFQVEFMGLREELEQARVASSLPEAPPGRQALNNWLVQTRLARG
jgi:predicted nucleotidyltransferase